MTARLRLGISACLLGQPVRYDGGHKRDRYLTDVLGRWVEWVPVCPEVEAGLGAPRPAMDLVAAAIGVRLIVRSTGQDLTEQVTVWTERWLSEASGLDGFVFKGDSPSCGVERVDSYPDDGGPPRRSGVGVFARAFMQRNPLLPVEEAGNLGDPAMRQSLIDRLYAMRRWRDFRAGEPGSAECVVFHAAAEMTLLAHHERRYRELGRLVGAAGGPSRVPVLDEYGFRYAEILRHRVTRRGHLKVLQHLAGRLEGKLDELERAELGETIVSYGEGRVPLVVPIELLRPHVGRHGDGWVQSQTYLHPYPDELMERDG